MNKIDKMFELLEVAEQRREERRRFIKLAGGAAASAGALSLLAACDSTDDDNQPTPTPSPTPTPTPTTAQADVDVLSFALNLEYLEGNYYSFGALGTGLPSSITGGIGTQGNVTGGRQVAFTDPSVRAYMREIASDENAHINFIRAQLGSSAIAQPAINIDGSATGAFTAAALAAGVITAGQTFDPYASDENFLIGAALLSDVGVTAYKGSAGLLVSKTVLEASAGILAVEAYHVGLIRSVLYRKGLTVATDRTNLDKIAAARDALDGNVTSAGPPAVFANDDQGLSPVTINGGLASNVVVSDSNGIVFGRTAPNVLNVVYQNKAAVSSGGFFPAGVNGNIKTSNNNA
jgi:hypothetical protein